MAYAIVKNQNGRVKTYKENIYRQMENYRFIASQTDKAQYKLGALNGKPAKQVYQDACSYHSGIPACNYSA